MAQGGKTRDAESSTQPVKQGPTWVPLKAAAAQAGVTVGTLRNWYRSGQIEARTTRGPRGDQRMVRLDEVVARAAGSPGAIKSSDPEDRWITLKEAAAEAGVSVSTLRNWYRKGIIKSKVRPGPHGDQRFVRLVEVRGRATKPGEKKRPAAGRDSDGERGSELVPVAKALPDLIRDLADARERAGRAETKAEFLSEQLAAKQQEVERLKRNGAGPTTAPAAIKAGSAGEDAQGEPGQEPSTLPPDFPPEEEDEFLALIPRWRARHKRRRILRRLEKGR